MRKGSALILARRWGVYAQPTTSEERVILALERAFPGSHWTQDQPPSASTASESARPTSASAGDDPLPSGSTGAVLSTAVYDYAFIGSSKIDGPAIEKWLKTLHPEASIVVTEPRWRKDETPMNSEALLQDLFDRDAYSPPLHKDLFGDKAREAQVEQVCCQGKTIVLAGNGSRVTFARNWLKRFPESYRPPVIEIGAK